MVNVAVIGTGFGMYHIDLYQKMNDVNVVTVMGRNNEKLMEVKEKYKIAVTTDYSAVVENPLIDVIDICVPTALHKEFAIKALENEKHVFCETPLSFKHQEALEIQEAAIANGKNVFVDLFTKYSAPHKIAIEFIDSGKIGQVRHVYSYNKTSAVWGDLPIKKSLYTFMIHNFDFLTEIFGRPKHVHAFGLNMDTSSTIEACYGYDNAMATVLCDSNLPHNSPFLIGFDVIGDKGSIRFNASFGAETTQSMVYNDSNENKSIEIPDTDDYQMVINHLLDCIRNNRKSETIDISKAIESLDLAIMTENSLLLF